MRSSTSGTFRKQCCGQFASISTNRRRGPWRCAIKTNSTENGCCSVRVSFCVCVSRACLGEASFSFGHSPKQKPFLLLVRRMRATPPFLTCKTTPSLRHLTPVLIYQTHKVEQCVSTSNAPWQSVCECSCTLSAHALRSQRACRPCR